MNFQSQLVIVVKPDEGGSEALFGEMRAALPFAIPVEGGGSGGGIFYMLDGLTARQFGEILSFALASPRSDPEQFELAVHYEDPYGHWKQHGFRLEREHWMRLAQHGDIFNSLPNRPGEHRDIFLFADGRFPALEASEDLPIRWGEFIVYLGFRYAGLVQKLAAELSEAKQRFVTTKRRLNQASRKIDRARKALTPLKRTDPSRSTVKA